MEKPVPTPYALNLLLIRRWSPRAFADKPVSKEVLLRVFEAARWAPSSSNEQPWRFIIGLKGTPVWDKIFQTLVEFNQKWANLAPVLALSLGNKISSKNNKLNPAYQYDVGQAVAHLTVQAMHEDLFVHQMGGFSKTKAVELFKIPEDYDVLTAIAIGYDGEPELLDEAFAEMEKKPRQRLYLDDLLFGEEFGSKASIL